MRAAAAVRLALAFLLVLTAVSAAVAVTRRVAQRSLPAAALPAAALPAAASSDQAIRPVEPPAPVIVRHRILAGDTLGGILGEAGVKASDVRAAALSLHDLARLREGRDLVLLYDDKAEHVIEVRYALGEDDLLVVSQDEGAWLSRVEHAHYQSTMQRLQVVVESTLWDAALGAGLRPADVVALADMFQSDIDFNTEVRAGATIDLVVQRRVRDDGFTKLGPPLAARFTNAGKTFIAIRFQAEGADQGAYFDDKGFSRKGAFLRSPIAFSRVTSGFSTGRYHPILKKKRPHWGTDFGAPVGTPVRAVARGRVTKAGRNGGHGNYVEIQHDGPQRTSYSHLSRISVHKGDKVAQGQKVGEVGTTGLSTGPHLHFQMWIKGKHVDAMKADLPRSERLSAAALPAFEQWRDRVMPVLEGRLDPAMLQELDLPG